MECAAHEIEAAPRSEPLAALVNFNKLLAFADIQMTEPDTHRLWKPLLLEPPARATRLPRIVGGHDWESIVVAFTRCCGAQPGVVFSGWRSSAGWLDMFLLIRSAFRRWIGSTKYRLAWYLPASFNG